MIKRKLDELGRIVIPIECRQQLDWQEKDVIDITVTGDSITLKKAIDDCVFCHSVKNLIKIGNTNTCVCRKCSDMLHEAKDGDILYPVKWTERL